MIAGLQTFPAPVQPTKDWRESNAGGVVQWRCRACGHEWRGHSQMRECGKPGCGAKELEALEVMSTSESGRRHMNGHAKPEAAKPEATPKLQDYRMCLDCGDIVAAVDQRLRCIRVGCGSHLTCDLPAGGIIPRLEGLPRITMRCNGCKTRPTDRVPYGPCECGATEFSTIETVDLRIARDKIARKKTLKKAKAKTNGAPVHPASTSTSTPAGIAANDPDVTPIAQPVTATGTVDVDLRKILPSPDNPRKTFPKDELDELATSIDAKGLQQPLEILPAGVHGMHELVDGERRFKALQQLAAKDNGRWKSAPCVVKTLTRDEARDYRLTTFVRAGLNAIDQARAFQARLDAGRMTQAQLGGLVGMTQGAIANKLRLLKGPEAFQAKIISGEMTEKQARELIGDFAEAPEVLDMWAKEMKGKSIIGRDLDDLYELNDVLYELSRPFSTTGWNKVEFKVTPEIEKQLDVRTIEKRRQAFNVKLFDELQQGAKSKKATGADQSETKQQEKKLTPAEIKERAKKQADIFARKLYRYKVAWLQERCVDRLNNAKNIPSQVLLRLLLHFSVEDQICSERGKDLAKAIAAHAGKCKKQCDYYPSLKAYESVLTLPDTSLWSACQAALAGMANHPFCDTTRVPLQPVQIEALAGELGIDIRSEWKCDDDFLELHNSEQLRGLQLEWKIVFSCGPRRSDLIEALQRHAMRGPLRCPKELLEAKAVKL